MARTYDSMRLRHEKAVDRLQTDKQRAIARQIGALVARYATARNAAGERIVPNQAATRSALRVSVWSSVLKPFYIGAGDNPFTTDGRPLSEYARLLHEGIAGATRIQVDRQVALLRQSIKDQTVLNWLTGPRPLFPVTETVYDPHHLFVDANGYRLSDRVWRTSIDVRTRIDRLLDYEISRGTSATRIADMLESFLTPGAGTLRTRTPYGKEGSYAARRLARTEITAAAGRATVNASQANPFVQGIRWALSRAHRCCDVCDDYAAGGENGDGVYPPNSVPAYPAHPHDMCNLQPVATGAVAVGVEDFRQEIAERTPRAKALQGFFNSDWLTQALMTGLAAEIIDYIRGRDANQDTDIAGI